MNNITLDELDHKIIEAFGRDGRASNRQIALELEITEGTIRTRVKRLQRRNLIHFTTVRSFRFAGSPNLVMFGIYCDNVRVPDIAETLAAMPEINCVIVMLGRYNILAMGLFASVEEVDNLLTSKIRRLPGFKRVETSIAIHNVKYQNAIARITPRQIVDAEEPGLEAEEAG
jgi:Lrp/AsnC family transcriptional regulator for asnA, asnC and gidA